jgi:hypothetical protein
MHHDYLFLCSGFLSICLCTSRFSTSNRKRDTAHRSSGNPQVHSSEVSKTDSQPCDERLYTDSKHRVSECHPAQAYRERYYILMCTDKYSELPLKSTYVFLCGSLSPRVSHVVLPSFRSTSISRLRMLRTFSSVLGMLAGI